MSVNHEGLWVKRLEYPCHQTLREKALHDAWITENESIHVLEWLLNGRIVKNSIGIPQQVIDRPVTQDEATLAATVIQWLGTHVGFDFLTRALRTAGYEVRQMQRKAQVQGHEDEPPAPAIPAAEKDPAETITQPPR